ncbi:MAG: hypothetical protein NT130_02810 [Candidatus Micrarchaeota archaeon]|nr:hypothetical protein [Candidatus Micrarchaeota archaeon]
MKKIKAAGLLSQFRSMENQAEDVLKKFGNLESPYMNTPYRISLVEQTRVLLEIYNNSIEEVVELGIQPTPDIRLILPPLLRTPSKLKFPEAALRKLIVNCGKVIGAMEMLTTALSEEDVDRLNSLKIEIAKLCEDIDPLFEKNLSKAIEGAEKGYFLGSVLITSRIIEYILDRFDGETLEDKIKFLVSNGVINADRKDVKETIIKANKKTRNFLSHRIDIFAESSDALALLGDSVRFLEIYKKLNQ